MRPLLFALLLVANSLLAQQPPLPPNALREQGVALYVSQRGIEFSGAYTILFGAYVARQDTLGVMEEDLKRGVSIKLGTFLCDALPRRLGTGPCTFVNADPVLGPAFVRASSAPDRLGTRLNLAALNGLVPAATRYALVVDVMELHSQERTAVYSISNRIVSEKRIARLGRIRLKLYDLQSGALVADADLPYDDERSPHRFAYFRLDDGAAAAEVFFARMFNTALVEVFRQVQGS